MNEINSKKPQTTKILPSTNCLKSLVKIDETAMSKDIELLREKNEKLMKDNANLRSNLMQEKFTYKKFLKENEELQKQFPLLRISSHSSLNRQCTPR